MENKILYFAVSNLCAFDIREYKPLLTKDQMLELLSSKGLVHSEIDILSPARDCIIASKYKRGSRLYEAPEFFDCSSFTKWLYGKIGVWIPRRSIQQYSYGVSASLESMVVGDLVFTTGHINYWDIDPNCGVGHVGIYTGNSIIHAANKERGVVEDSVERFLSNCEFRGIRRFIHSFEDTVVIRLPENREIESSDDIRWILLQSSAK